MEAVSFFETLKKIVQGAKTDRDDRHYKKNLFALHYEVPAKKGKVPVHALKTYMEAVV